MLVRDDSHSIGLTRRFAIIRDAARLHAAPPLGARRAHLAALERLLKTHGDELARAIDADFGRRPAAETRLIEIFPALEAARHARRHLRQWAAPQRRPVAPYFLPARARVVWQPLGVVGIIVPWNYPLLLALQPLVGALAAGNRAMLKMSEHTPRTAHVLAALVHEAFAADHVRVETGGVDVARAFAALPFDHLLFTGSTATGRSVLRAAAPNLTPVTLELGGKSPAIVGRDAAIATAAARIMSGKCRNAGQTCVAPDYALVPQDRIDAFVGAAARVVNRRYPALDGPDYTAIIDGAHFDRLAALLDDAADRGATIVPLHVAQPRPDRERRLFPPTIVTGVDERMRIMHEEIFGPILPVRGYATLDEAIGYVNARPRALALSYFGHAARDVDAVVTRTVSGGVCLNDVVLQFAQNDLPFGGIGESGIGAYHGRAGFERFSHAKAVFEQTSRPASGLLEPPYGRRFAALLKLLMR